METNKLTKKNKITLIIGIVLFLILVLSASYAYFQITSVNNGISTTVTGTGEEIGSPTLTTNTTNLKLNLTADLMSSNNTYFRMYATPTGEAVIENGLYPYSAVITTPVVMGNGRYKLATATVSTSDLSYNCTYSFDVSASVTKTITDKSDQDIHVIVTSPKGETYRYRLDELLDGAKTINGVISNLSVGENQEFTIESYIYNHALYSQNDLTDNTYTVSVTPKSGTSGFKCEVATEPVITGFAKNLIDSGDMIETNLEGDGYRFVGTGTGLDEYCSYDNGKYYLVKPADTCPDIYTVTQTYNDNSYTNIYKYERTCSQDDYWGSTITCTPLTGIPVNSSVLTNNVCFGTNDKSECLNNPDKYMYKIIGVFSDEIGNKHVKLIKKISIGKYGYHSTDNIVSIDWHDTDLYKGLNGSYFYTNTDYDYMQNSTWRNKIENWRWTEATSRVQFRGSSIDTDRIAPMSYSSDGTTVIQKETYLHEMNRNSKKYTLGNWRYVNAKIGLMYVSDLYLSLPLIGDDVLYNLSSVANYYGTSWLNFNIENTNSYKTATMSEEILSSSYNYCKFYSINMSKPSANNNSMARVTILDKNNTTVDIQPVFYLNSDVELSSGIGTETDPYILK